MGYFRIIQGDFSSSQGREKKKCCSDNAILITGLVRFAVLFDSFNYLALVRWISSIHNSSLKRTQVIRGKIELELANSFQFRLLFQLIALLFSSCLPEKS